MDAAAESDEESIDQAVRSQNLQAFLFSPHKRDLRTLLPFRCLAGAKNTLRFYPLYSMPDYKILFCQNKCRPDCKISFSLKDLFPGCKISEKIPIIFLQKGLFIFQVMYYNGKVTGS